MKRQEERKKRRAIAQPSSQANQYQQNANIPQINQ
jgi:hypothetical protein